MKAVTERYDLGTVIHVRAISPARSVVGVWGVSSPATTESVTKTIEDALIGKNLRASGLPNVGEFAPLICEIEFNDNNSGNGTLSFGSAQLYSPNGELVLSIERAELEAMFGDNAAEQAFYEHQNKLLGEAYADPDAFRYLNWAFDQAITHLISTTQKVNSFAAIGAVSVGADGEYVTDPASGQPQIDMDILNAFTAQMPGAANDVEEIIGGDEAREEIIREFGKDYEAQEAQDANEPTIPGDPA
jgi:hypothetical protein